MATAYGGKQRFTLVRGSSPGSKDSLESPLVRSGAVESDHQADPDGAVTIRSTPSLERCMMCAVNQI